MLRTRLQAVWHSWTPTRSLATILALGLIHGLIYVFMVPPWLHNDEPGHFEYAYLAAHMSHWPNDGEFDPEFRNRLVSSLKATGWYKKYRSSDPADLVPLLGSTIGVPQTGDLPGYYFLTGLALRVVPSGTGLVFQMYVARLVSLILSAITIFLAWMLMRELVSPGNALQWMVPAFIALLPGFVDMMTAVNNDVAGVAAGTLFLWLSLRLLRGRFAVINLAAWAGSILVCISMTESSRLLAVTAPLVVILGLVRGRPLRAALLVLGAAAAILLFVSLAPGGAADWYQSPSYPLQGRNLAGQAPFGRYALNVSFAPGANGPATGQFLSQDLLERLREKTVTLGVWIWADRPVNANLPYLRLITGLSPSIVVQQIPVGTTPAFHEFTEQVSRETLRAFLDVPLPTNEPTPVTLYFDGFVLAEGEYSPEIPQFTDASLAGGTWGGKRFTNLIRNPSLERGAIAVRPWVDQVTSKVPIVHGRASLIVAGLQDWEGAGWYYRAAASRLFQTFWATTAAANFVLPGRYDYNLLQILSLIAALGLGRWLWRRRAVLLSAETVFAGAAFALIWGAALFRGAPELTANSPVIPFARYGGPVIALSALLICVGWKEAMDWTARRFKPAISLPVAAFWTFMGGTALYACLSFSEKFYAAAQDVSRLILFGLLILFALELVKLAAKWLSPIAEDSQGGN